jgi:hypothetical protein
MKIFSCKGLVSLRVPGQDSVDYEDTHTHTHTHTPHTPHTHTTDTYAHAHAHTHTLQPEHEGLWEPGGCAGSQCGLPNLLCVSMQLHPPIPHKLVFRIPLIALPFSVIWFKSSSDMIVSTHLFLSQAL